jgi:hypothetical protein
MKRSLLLTILCIIPAMGLTGSITCRGPNYYPTMDELQFALAAASISDEATRARIIGPGRLHLNVCASELRSKICNDGMIMGMLSKDDSIKGGAVGLTLGALTKRNTFDAMLTGAMLGGGVGAVSGMTKLAACNKLFVEEINPIADKLKKLPQGSDANLQLFLDGIDNSANGYQSSIRPDQARFLKDQILKWVANFKR